MCLVLLVLDGAGADSFGLVWRRGLHPIRQHPASHRCSRQSLCCSRIDLLSIETHTLPTQPAAADPELATFQAHPCYFETWLSPAGDLCVPPDPVLLGLQSQELISQASQITIMTSYTHSTHILLLTFKEQGVWRLNTTQQSDNLLRLQSEQRHMPCTPNVKFALYCAAAMQPYRQWCLMAQLHSVACQW